MAGFGGAVKLTGESEYRKALKQITIDLKEVDSELKLVASQYAKNDKSQEALTAQTEALNKKLDAEAKKIGVLKDNYTQLSKQAEDNKSKHAALAKELAEAANELNRIEQESGKTSAEYKLQADYVAGLTADYDKSTKAIENQESALSKARSEINNAQSAYNSTERALSDLGSEMQDTTDDTKELGKEVEDSGKKADSAGKGGFTVFKGALANLASDGIRIAISGLKKLGGALVDLSKDALNSYANYEQLTGGIETLFGNNGMTLEEYTQKVVNSAGNTSAALAQASAASENYARAEAANAKVLENAAEAYKTVGMSANEYMENVTSFSASLISSLGGDTLKASEIADQALRDISDNANKMGTDISQVQSAFQGLAKGQYQLLDNLKLGYAGSQAGAKQLLADAQKITGVKYDLSNLADVYEAIHVIQTEMGITGTVQKESEKTITGSINTLKGAWANLITGVADDNADLEKLTKNFSDSILTVSKNVLPRVKTIISSLGQLASTLLRDLVPQLVEMIPPLLNETLPVLISGIEETLKALMSILPEMIPIIFNAVNTLIVDLATWLSEEDNLKTILDGILELATQLVNQFALLLPVLLPAVFNIIGQVAEFLTDPQNILLLVDSTLTIIGAVVMALVNSIPEIIGIFTRLFGNIGENFKLFKDTVGAAIANAFTAAKNKVTEFFTNIKNKVTDWFKNLGTALKQKRDEFKTKIATFCQNCLDWFKELPKKILDVGKSVVTGVWDGITSKVQWIKDKIKSLSSTITDAFKSALGIHSPSSIMRDTVGKQIAAGVGVGFESEMKKVSADMQKSLPKSFDVDANVKTNGLKSTGGIDYYTMVNAFKEALTGVDVELDDQKVGKFVKKTVSDAIYT